MARVLQCVASAGVLSRVSRNTRSICASPTWRGAPGRGSSSNPSSRRAPKRWRHLPTVWWVSPSSCATAVLGLPAAHSKTIRERCASACALLGRRAQRSSVARSSTVRLNGAIGLPVRISVPPHIEETLAAYILFNVFMTQDTSTTVS